MQLTIKELEAIDVIRQRICPVNAFHEIHPRAYVVAKEGASITIAIPSIDSPTGSKYHKCVKYKNLEIGEWCFLARVDSPGEPTQWAAAPLHFLTGE